MSLKRKMPHIKDSLSLPLIRWVNFAKLWWCKESWKERDKNIEREREKNLHKLSDNDKQLVSQMLLLIQEVW